MPKYRPTSTSELQRLVDDLSIKLNDIDTSLITDMRGLFKDSKRHGKDFSGIGEWDTSKVRNMGCMFEGADGFNEDISKWDVSRVVCMDSMFRCAYNFNKPLNSWDVSRVDDMMFMFCGAFKFNQPLDKWDVSRVGNMLCMFEGAREFNQNIDSWDTSRVQSMEAMFCGAASFNQPLNSWNVSRVLNMDNMFNGAAKFNQPLDKWDVSKVEYMDDMFLCAWEFKQNLADWDTVSVKKFNGTMFYGTKLTRLPKWYMRGDDEFARAMIDAKMFSLANLIERTASDGWGIRLCLLKHKNTRIWGKEQVQRLLDDIWAHRNDKAYVLGSLVFKQLKGRAIFLDGRQRLMGLELLLRALGDKGFLNDSEFIWDKACVSVNLRLIKAWCKDKFKDDKAKSEFAQNLKTRIEFIAALTRNAKSALLFLGKGGKKFSVDEKARARDVLRERDLEFKGEKAALNRTTTRDANELQLCNIGSLIFHQIKIPPYHRHYVWGTRQVKAFLNGIKRAFDGKYEFEMGTVITTYQIDERGNGLNIMLDGQQRLTTLWLVGFYFANKKSCGKWAKKWKRLIFYTSSGELRIIAQPEFTAVLSEFANSDYELALFKGAKLGKIANALRLIRAYFDELEGLGVDLQELACFVYLLANFYFVQLALDDNGARHFFERTQCFWDS